MQDFRAELLKQSEPEAQEIALAIELFTNGSLNTFAKKTKPSKDYAVPLWEKANLTVYEAAAYSGIGADKLRELSDREDCEFVLWNGTKRLIKRKKLDEFLERAYSI